MGTRHEELVTNLRNLAEKVVEQAGVELVELTLKGSSGRRLLRVDIDRAGPHGVDLADCQGVSHVLGEALDEAGLLETSFVLEVSSPGVDRPIRSEDDYRRNTGRRIVLSTREPIGGRRSFRGVRGAGRRARTTDQR